jgi:hypothetical protein
MIAANESSFFSSFYVIPDNLRAQSELNYSLSELDSQFA